MNFFKLFVGLCIITGGFIEINAQVNNVNPDKSEERNNAENEKRNNAENEKRNKLVKEIFSFYPVKRKGKDEKKWFLTMGGFFIMQFGNTETFNTNGSFSVQFDDGIANFEAGYRTFYGENKSLMNEHNGNGILKFDYYVIKRLEIFVFSMGEYNEITKLLFRNNTGAGLKFVAFKNKYWKTDISAAPIFQYEKFVDKDETYEARASFRYRIKITPIDVVELALTYFYIPKFENWLHYRMVLDTYLRIGLSTLACKAKGVHFKLGYIRNHNENAVPGTEKIDQKIYGELQLKL